MSSSKILGSAAIGLPASVFAALYLATLPFGTPEQVRGWELEYLVTDTLNHRAQNDLTPTGANVELDCRELRYKWQDFAHQYYLAPLDQDTRASITDVVTALLETKMVDVTFELDEDNIAALEDFLSHQNKLSIPEQSFVAGQNFTLHASCE